jgi:autotransporter strand-loop-strand O-heptosyltransferase
MKRNASFFRGLKKNLNNYVEIEPSVNISFNFGIKVTIGGHSKRRFRVEFWNTETGELEFTSIINSGHFAAPNKQYAIKWKVKVYENEILVRDQVVDFKGKRVYVCIDSSSLGDTLAWVPQAVKFAEINQCTLVLSTFHNYLFEEKYPKVIWNIPGTSLPEYDYSYKIGYFYDDESSSKTPRDPREVPLGQVICDILNIPHEEVRPLISYTPTLAPPIKERYVCIATTSTAGAKLWNREGGWQEVIDFLRTQGYQVMVIQKEPTDLKRVIDCTGNIPLTERLDQLYWCDFFIGLGSGLSWLAWGMKKKVILISGFSSEFAEFTQDCERIINKDVCNSCWNDTSVEFDKGDWFWCPKHKGTPRHFECTKKISPMTIVDAINKIRN